MTFPTPPNTGTGLTTPLVSVEQYRQVTGDMASNEVDVERELDEAIRDVGIECVRTWGYGNYTENLHLYATGMVFPSATPVDTNQPIYSGEELFDPATDKVPGGTSIIQGAGIWVGFFSPLPWMPVWTGVIPPQTVITYSGGYYPWQSDPTTVTTDTLPGKLARIFITVAYYSLNPSVVTAMGQTSTSIAGVSLAGGLSSFMRVDPALKKAIQRFKRPQAYRWER